MSIECGECERDLRGGHDPSCSRYVPPPVCPHCVVDLRNDIDCWECPQCRRSWVSREGVEKGRRVVNARQ